MSLLEKIRNYGSLIRFSHTVFALPFALASVALAWPSHPVTLRGFFWILIAMVGARSAAMAFNRLVDRKFDALNPRTQQWELPQGSVKVREAVVLTVISSVVFVYAAYQLNFVCFVSIPRRPHNCFLLFLNQALYLGLTLVSWACSFACPHGGVACSFGLTHRFTGAGNAFFPRFSGTLLVGGFRHHLFAPRP